MSHLIGEYECKVDPKSRMMVPADLKRKLPDEGKAGLVVNRGFGDKKHLVIYTKSEWDKKLDELSKLNEYEEENIQVVRYFTRGATELTIDGAGKVLLPRFLLEYAGIKNDIVLACMLNKIEVWAPEVHRSLLNDEPENFAPIMRRVLGNKTGGSNE